MLKVKGNRRTWHPFVFGPEFACRKSLSLYYSKGSCTRTMESNPGPVCFSMKFSSCRSSELQPCDNEDTTHWKFIAVYRERACPVPFHKIAAYNIGPQNQTATLMLNTRREREHEPWHMKFGTLGVNDRLYERVHKTSVRPAYTLQAMLISPSALGWKPNTVCTCGRLHSCTLVAVSSR